MWYKLGSEYESGGAGLISSADDYMKFLEALRTGDKILKKETVAAMATDRLTPAQDRSFWMGQHNGYGYGLGMRCKKSKSRCEKASEKERTLAAVTETSAATETGAAPTDFGWGGAAGSYAAADAEKKISFVYTRACIKSPRRRFFPVKQDAPFVTCRPLFRRFCPATETEEEYNEKKTELLKNI